MENSAPDRQQVRVTILSRPYTLLATGDPREVEEVAASVNDLMLSIAAKSPNADSTRIAVLACLHLADKLHEFEQKGQQADQEFSTRVHELERELEESKDQAGRNTEELAERVRELELELDKARQQASRKNEE